MSNEKFTQGEWGVFGNKNMLKHYIVLNPQKDVKEQKIIADVFCCGGDVGANAALIAAAPEMYGVLKRLVDLTDYAELVGVIHDAKAVLMKASGQTEGENK